MTTIRDEIDEEISYLLNEDEHFKSLSEEGKKEAIERLNGMLHHTLYIID